MVKLPKDQALKGIGPIGIAGLVSGATGFIIMILTAKLLTPALNAEFMVFWSLIMWVFGSLLGIQYETIRSVRAATNNDISVTSSGSPTAKPDGVRVAIVGLAMTMVVGFVMFLTSFIWAPRVFGHDPLLSALIISVTVGLYGGYCAVLGALGGKTDWNRASMLMIAEALIRFMALLIAVTVWANGSVFVKIATCLSVTTWLVFVIVGKGYRDTFHVRGDSTGKAMVRQTSQVIVANFASSALVVGFPTLLGLVVGHSVIQSSAGLLFAISMTRAPLLFPLNAFQSVLVAYFVKHDSNAKVIIRLILGTLGIGIVVAIVAGLVGPPLLTLLRPEYHLTPIVVTGLTMAAACLALVVLTGTLTLAIRLHGICMSGWLVAIVVSISILLVPFPLTMRVIASLLVGPICGTIIHVGGILRSFSRH